MTRSRCARKRMIRLRELGALLLTAIAGCRTISPQTRDVPPTALLGAFLDDYDTQYRISATTFVEGRSAYRIIEWRPQEQYFIAQNADTNRTDAGKFSRFDWVMLGEQGAYSWGYCHSAWKAPSADSARATRVVDPANPRVGCNKHPYTRMKPLAGVSHSRMVIDTLHSRALRGNRLGDSPDRRVTIYLPPSYDRDTTRRYPVVYLLHGATSDPKEWFDGTYQGLNLQAALDQRANRAEYLVVMPFADNRFGGTFYVNSLAFGRWEDFVSTELVHFVDSRFRTKSTRTNRVLAGQSMGGFGALYVGGRHADVFGHVYAMSPCCTGFVGDIAPDGERWRADPRGWARAMSMAFAPVTTSTAIDSMPPLPFVRQTSGAVQENVAVANHWRSLLPLDRLMRDPSGYRRLCSVGLEAGRQDAITNVPAGAAAFSRELTRAGVANSYDEFTGGHVDRTRERFETVALPFFEKAFSGTIARC